MVDIFYRLLLYLSTLVYIGRKSLKSLISIISVAGGRGVGEKPEYLEANLQLDCQHIFSLQKERKLVNACMNKIHTNTYMLRNTFAYISFIYVIPFC